MKLGLLGYPLTHSASPQLYQKLLGAELNSYQLFEFEKNNIPELAHFSKSLHGLNITSPYKTHFVNQIIIESELVKSLGAVNTLAFLPGGAVLGTNTDVLAVREILHNYSTVYPRIKLILLGDGVMAGITKIVAEDLGLELHQFSRKSISGLENMDLSIFQEKDKQNIIINACSRAFSFRGSFSGDEIFWDYNYSFLPHSNSLPLKLKSYQDGQEMLELQAKAAIKFWKEVLPKLK